MARRKRTGGQGGRPPRSDLKLEEQALRQDWPTPPKVKKAVLQRIVNYIDSDDPADDPEDPKKESEALNRFSPRTVIAAARVLAQFGRLSLGQQQLDLAREALRVRHGNEDGDSIEPPGIFIPDLPGPSGR